jgi:hypothetical protein
VKKVVISQDELEQANGQFQEYMQYVERRLSSKYFEPAMVLFNIVDIIKEDGYDIELGSVRDDAAINVEKWVNEFYAERGHISFCFPGVAHKVNGAVYLLRMPVNRVSEIMLTQAVMDLTQLAADMISPKQLERLESDYNDFYNCYYDMSKFHPTVVTHLESSAQKIYSGSAHFALSRWESLHFVEKAMKEVLSPLGVKFTGSNGHDIRGALYDEWLGAGLSPLPVQLLEDVMCSAKIRYEKTLQPFDSTLRAYHSAIRLGGLIAKQLPSIPEMHEELSMKVGEFSLDAVMAFSRLILAVDPQAGNWPKVKLLK